MEKAQSSELKYNVARVPRATVNKISVGCSR